jgi:hypothetical protein
MLDRVWQFTYDFSVRVPRCISSHYEMLCNLDFIYYSFSTLYLCLAVWSASQVSFLLKASVHTACNS